MKTRFLFLYVILLVTNEAIALAGDATSPMILPEYEFTDRENPQIRVDQAIERSIENDKLLLLVLGAQWCHDSRSLAQQFSSDAMQAILTERFETVFINVGYYKDLRELTSQFGYPGYFATPSVMVIDPKTKQHLNMQSMEKWNTADSLPTEAFIEYFSTVGKEKPLKLTEEMLRDVNLALVQDFAFRETARLFIGFERLSPMIQSAVDNTQQDDERLRALSDEIYQFRMTLQRDIHRLHKQALDNAAKKKSAALELPTYGPFSWEG